MSRDRLPRDLEERAISAAGGRCEACDAEERLVVELLDPSRIPLVRLENLMVLCVGCAWLLAPSRGKLGQRDRAEVLERLRRRRHRRQMLAASRRLPGMS